MREAKVAVSVMGDETQQNLTLRGLQNSAGFLQSKIANRIETRYTPRLQFTIDKGQQNALVVGELLAKIRREKQADEVDQAFDEPSPGEDIGGDESSLGETPLDSHADVQSEERD